jgi:hypothetical protein
MSDALPMILALDVSKRCTGICWGRIGDTPTFSSIKPGRNASDDTAMRELGEWLITWTRANKPNHIFYEAPLLRGKFDVPILRDLAGFVRGICAMKRIPARIAHVNSVRKAFLGSGIPQEPKQQALAMCCALGWRPSNEDEADAGAVWWWGCLQVKPHAAQIITPMMQQRVASHVVNRRIGEDAGIF